MTNLILAPQGARTPITTSLHLSALHWSLSSSTPYMVTVYAITSHPLLEPAQHSACNEEI